MARVSKTELSTEQQDDLSRQLTAVIGKIDAQLANRFLFEFFGREEKIMLAKRLAIIALLHEGRPIHRIAVYLHTSESTVAKLYERYERQEFVATIEALTSNKQNYHRFIDILDNILTVGGIMPHRNYIMKPKKLRH